MSRVYTMSDDEIVAAEGELFVIELEGNPTTGYEWELQFDKNRIKTIDREYEPPGETLGGGGSERFTLQAIDSGDTSIRAIYKRAWEPEPLEEKDFKVHIHK